jgi:uncharacterized protein (DUF2336 family)
MSELKPCPKCGEPDPSIADLYIQDDFSRKHLGRSIKCWRCDEDEHAPTEEEAVKKWNKREREEDRMRTACVKVAIEALRLSDRFFDDELEAAANEIVNEVLNEKS